MKVAFIGLGNMGTSLAKAVAKEVAAPDLLLVNRSPQKVQDFISQCGDAIPFESADGFFHFSPGDASGFVGCHYLTSTPTQDWSRLAI